MNHTPGPWRYNHIKRAVMSCAELTGDYGHNPAKVIHQCSKGATIEQIANAKLIAAAPSLLIALQALRQDVGASKAATDVISDETFAMVSAALELAE